MGRRWDGNGEGGWALDSWAQDINWSLINFMPTPERNAAFFSYSKLLNHIYFRFAPIALLPPLEDFSLKM